MFGSEGSSSLQVSSLPLLTLRCQAFVSLLTYEHGKKTSLFTNKLVSSFSLCHALFFFFFFANNTFHMNAESSPTPALLISCKVADNPHVQSPGLLNNHFPCTVSYPCSEFQHALLKHCSSPWNLPDYPSSPTFN